MLAHDADAVSGSPAPQFEVAAEYRAWAEGRAGFNRDLKTPGSPAQAAKWEKTYYRGLRPDGSEGSPEHRIKLRLRSFKSKGQ